MARTDELETLQATNGGYRELETVILDDTGDATIEAGPSEFSMFIMTSNEGDIGLTNEVDATTETLDEGTPTRLMMSLPSVPEPRHWVRGLHLVLTSQLRWPLSSLQQYSRPAEILIIDVSYL